MTTCEKVVQDFGNELTTLYYQNCKKGFKFIGDDPENKVIKIPQDIIDVMLSTYNLSGLENDMPATEYLQRFYLHNRCLLFTEGIWMSETAGVPHALVYKPGTYLNFKMAGMTRLTALTDGASCMCTGPDPGSDELGYYKRLIHHVDTEVDFTPSCDTIDVVVPTQEMWYNGKQVNAGTPYRITKPGKIKLIKPGYIVEFWLSDVNLEESVIDYCKMWVNKDIIFKERHARV